MEMYLRRRDVRIREEWGWEIEWEGWSGWSLYEG